MRLNRSSTESNPQLSKGAPMNNKAGTRSKWRRGVARASLLIAALAALAAVFAPTASAMEFEYLKMNYTEPDGTTPLRQAGGHPDIRTEFAQTPVPPGVPLKMFNEHMHRFEIDLPPGLLANAAKLPQCPPSGLKAGPNGNNAVCPIQSQIGVGLINGGVRTPIYNVTPPKGMPALFAFNFLGSVVYISPTVRAGDYAITFDSGVISQAIMLHTMIIVFWGVPADSSHDVDRVKYVGGGPSWNNPSPAPQQPFTMSPTYCSATPAVSFGRLDGWKTIGQFDTLEVTKDALGEDIKFTGCDQLGFEPTVEAKPTTTVADSPTGLDVSIKIPQNEDPDGYSEAQMRDVAMTLPEGMTLNPASAAGLGVCTPAQIGLTSPVGQAPPRFNGEKASCPDDSKLGTVNVDTALLANPMPGAIYFAQPHENPFGSLISLYIEIEDEQSGIRIKLAGDVKRDPATGQLEVSFKDNPQLPFESFDVSMFTGPRAALKTPLSCGTHTTNSTLVPWTAPAGATRLSANSYAINQGPSGDCVTADGQAPNAPSFEAGTVDPTAGAHSPFVLKVHRADGTQRIKRINAALPKGLLARLAGVPYCSDAALAEAAGKTGKAEEAGASCPSDSQVGTVDVAAGAGSMPFHTPGKAYLAGPYRGAPLSLAFITPAVAGPIDLGNVVVRTALNVNPVTTEIKAVSDEIPSILEGIPLDIRSVVIDMNRPSFTLNPTSCNPLAVNGSLVSVLGQAAAVSSRFQVGGCGALGFKPHLKLALKGSPKRAKYQRLTATLNARPGDANIGRAAVTLPHSVFLAQEHIRTICTRAQWAANACPQAAIYGKATAWSPLLDEPLSGYVYLRSSDNQLPDLVADLRGQIRVELVGRIDSHKRGIRTTFETVPDAPVSKFVLEMQGGKKSLIVNSRNLCKSVSRADVQFDGQNGKAGDSKPVGTNSCKKKRKGAKKSKRGARHSRR
jgi:hypothetical protein